MRIGSRWRSSCLFGAIFASQRVSEMSSKLLRDARFHPFKFFRRHAPALFFFDQVIEQEFPPAPFAPISECFSRKFALKF